MKAIRTAALAAGINALCLFVSAQAGAAGDSRWSDVTSSMRVAPALTPNTLGDAAQDLVYVPIAPCRIVDTRQSYGGSGPLAANSTTAFDGVAASFAGQGGKASDCGIPAGAAALATTIGVLDATAQGDLRVWAADGTVPNASIAVFSPAVTGAPQPGQIFFSGASAIIPLCQTGCPQGKEFKVLAEAAQLDLTIDVTGYFRAAVMPAVANGAGQGLNWGTIARDVIGNATAQLRNDGTAPLGTGSLEITVGSGSDKVHFGDQVSFAGTALATVSQVGYVVKTTQENIDAASGAANMPSIQIELWTKGVVGSDYSTLNYSPTVNSTAYAWSGYIDAAADTSNAWGLTGSAFNSPATAANCGINGPRCTFAQVKTLLTSPPYNATMISFGVGKGRDYPWHGEIDSVRLNGTTYDFEAQGVRSVPTP